MANWYPEWVALLDDTIKSGTSRTLEPRIAQQIIDAITELKRERDELRQNVRRS